MPSSKIVTTIDPSEIDKFSAMAAEWWDPDGKFGVLHKFNPVRLDYIREHVTAHFGLEEQNRKPFSGLRFLDIGCGGGLLCEPMSRLGAEVVGVDPAEKNIKTASVHADEQGLLIDYRCATAEDLSAQGEQFDVILNMEVVEHVADVDLFLSKCAQMVKPGGIMFVATINRTMKSFALAIIGAEYILGWLPKGTHQWEKFLTPQEIQNALKVNDMQIDHQQGVFFNPLRNQWLRSKDKSVNYMMISSKPGK